jgi:flagellar protein FliL
MANRIEATADAATAASGNGEDKSSSGGLKAWLPLIVVIVGMPALAYVTTTFVLLPKLQKSIGGSDSHAAAGEKSEHGGGKESNKPKHTFQLSKVLVNVAGSVGTRYLIANYTLVGSSADFKTKVEENKDQLLDLAASVMSSKTISDLEKPGARNLIRNELISVFNNALGGSVIKEIYITEFAIQ